VCIQGLGRWILGAAAAALLAAGPAAAASDDGPQGKEKDLEGRVRSATAMLQQIQEIPEKSIPPKLLRNVHAVALIPGVVKVGFVVGGRFGRGVLMVRRNNGSWSPPAFVTLTGGSFGWQIGAQSSDVILVFKNRENVEAIIDGEVTLGGDANVAAGPVGRQTSASTNIKMEAEIYSYSRSRGLFAGVSLNGAAITIDEKSNKQFYNRPGLQTHTILYGEGLTVPGVAQDLLGVLDEAA
jgi:lipid-binding SYLF domain-containing protein